MRYAITPLAFAVGSSALAIRQSQQCVQLQASGGASGVLGQLYDGQNRIGGGYGAACYCLDSNGGFTDSSGRGCILTPPTTQFQCDVGASPTNGFSINGGSVAYNGNTKFYACPYNENGGYNVYTQPAPGQTKCVEISLGAGQSCGAGNGGGASQSPAASQPGYSVPAPSKPAASAPAPAPSAPAPAPSAPAPAPSAPAPAPSAPAPAPSAPAPAPSAPAPAPSAPAPQPGVCPADLNGQYEYPHLIVPVSSSKPSSVPGTSYNGVANGDVCSLFNFDVPQSYSGKSCSLVFLFPTQKDLQTSSYTVSGSGGLEFSKCSTIATANTSWDTKGTCTPVKTVDNVAPGNSYTILSEACPAGQTVTVEMCATGGLSLSYFQDYNPSPVGAYIRAC